MNHRSVAMVVFIGFALFLAMLFSTTYSFTTPQNLVMQAQRAPDGVPVIQAGKEENGTGMSVSEVVTPSLSLPLTELTPLHAEVQLNHELNPRLNQSTFLGGVLPADSDAADGLVERSYNPNGVTPPVGLSFDGIDFATGGTGSPPDTVGDVGPNHYFQSVNGSFRIYNKSGTPLTAVAANNTIWAGAGGTCQTRNDGDPVVVYDELADRWLFTQFITASPYAVCVAVSQTSDPTGAWYRYQFATGGTSFPDYFKFGVWPNAYYMSANESTYTAYAFDRTRILSGLSATFIKYTGQTNFLLPADVDGGTAPPATSPGLFYTFKDDSYHGGGADRIELFAFAPNFTTPANSTFTLINTIPVTAFTYTVCGFFTLSCVPQQGTTAKLDALSEWPMFRFAYRNFGTHQSMVGNFTVDVGSDRAGLRWFELRNTGSGWSLYQEGTYAPGTEHRFVGSIAQDQSGNIALGYSTSGSTMFPALRYATRLSTDPLGTLGSEVTLQAGGGSQTASHSRWGDYAAMSVDPTNGCTFWFTSEYFQTSGSQWRTRIGTFTIPECLRLSASFSSPSICVGQTAQVTLTAGTGYSSAVTLTGSGNPALSTLTFGTNPISPPFPATSIATIGNTAGVTPGTYTLVFTGTAGSTVGTASTALTIAAAPPAPSLTTPANSAILGTTTPTLTWSAVSGATSYTIEIASDPAFTTIIQTGTSATNSYTVSPALATNAAYYWRVRATTSCGVGANATVFRFAILPSSTASLCRSGLSTAIPDNTVAGVTDTLAIPNTGTIADVNVSTTITHTYVGDLIVTLVSPANTSVVVIDRPGYTGTGFGCGNNHIRATLDDAASTPVEGICATSTGANPPPYAIDGTYQPNNVLSAFDGQALNGNWRLVVSDRAGGDTGRLKEWCVIATTSTSADFSDLANSYGVAWHTGTGALRLGSQWSADSSIPALNADDPSDDGVAVDTTTNWHPGGSSTATIQVTGGNGYAAAWFDWNQNGVFDHPSEKVFGQTVTAGINNIAFTIPVGAILNQPVKARFRLYTSEPGLSGTETPLGGTTGGEVEDYSSFTPLAVELALFDATRVDTGVHVGWETAAEWDTLGFNLWRSDTPATPQLKLNDEVILSQSPGNGQGAIYEWLDATALPIQPYFYWLESVDIAGQTRLYGPVSVEESPPTAVTVGEVGTTSDTSFMRVVVLGALAIAGLMVLGWRRRI